MPNPGSEDFKFIRNELRRNLITEMCHKAQIKSGERIPDEIFLAAGLTKDEIDALSISTKQFPLNDTDLRG